jgi:hypothetical protein
MIRSALLAAAGLAAAASFACVAYVPPGPPPGSAARPVLGGMVAQSGPRSVPCTSNPPPFLANAQILMTPYDPDPGHHGNNLPTGAGPVPDPYCTSLLNAYNAESLTFQQQLDGLTNVFIDQSGSCSGQSACVQHSWGLRDRQTGKTFVALPAGLWDSSNDVQNYSDFETTLVTQLLGFSPIAVAPTPNTQNLTVLAALAHEMGHLKWWEKKVETLNCSNPPSGATRKFADNTWIRHNNATPKFQYFGVEHPGNAPMGGVDKNVIRNDPPNQLPSDLAILYDGLWASIFSTVTPDEDFVETYKLWALASAGLSSIKVTWTGQTTPVEVFQGGPLSLKVQWIRSCLQWP